MSGQDIGGYWESLVTLWVMFDVMHSGRQMETPDIGELTSEILLSLRLRAKGVVLGIFTVVSTYDITGKGE